MSQKFEVEIGENILCDKPLFELMGDHVLEGSVEKCQEDLGSHPYLNLRNMELDNEELKYH